MERIIYGSKEWVFFLHDILENPSKLRPDGPRTSSWNPDEVKSKIEDLLKSGKASESRLWIRLGTNTLHYHIEESPSDVYTVEGEHGKLHVYLNQDAEKLTGLTEDQISSVLSLITGIQADIFNIKMTGDRDLDNVYIIEFPPLER